MKPYWLQVLAEVPAIKACFSAFSIAEQKLELQKDFAGWRRRDLVIRVLTHLKVRCFTYQAAHEVLFQSCSQLSKRVAPFYHE